MGIQYRPEVDGLRALAVVAVVLFHAGVGAAGYVGVDVFFVISGYLITSILVSEPRIDLLAFYARRVRRIVPAATLVVLLVLAFAWLLPERDAPQEAERSAAAALLFVANVFFEFSTGGYWSPASDEMPLLHLWSLSVEEQFYLLWPALLMITRSRKVFGAMALVSFALAEYWMATNPDAAFFRMPARFWELAIGGLVALSPRVRLSPVMGWLGIVLTLVACVAPLAHFPASGALPAVVGAGVVLAYVHGGGTNRWLASKPMVFVGLVSYSLYLWHWPLLALYRARGGDSQMVQLALCVLALVLAIATYRHVEQPFRRMRFPSGRTIVAGASASLLLALSACAVGLREPPPPTQQFQASAEWRAKLKSLCAYVHGDPITKCPQPADATVTVWGDSMARSWGLGLPGSVVYNFPGCAPIVGRDATQSGCRAFNDLAVRNLKGDTLYLVARWGMHETFDLTSTLQAVHAFKRVIVIGPTPSMRATPEACLRAALPCTIPRDTFAVEDARILAALRAQAAPFANVEVWDVIDDFCSTTCGPQLDGMVLYADRMHPSAALTTRVIDRRTQ